MQGLSTDIFVTTDKEKARAWRACYIYVWSLAAAVLSVFYHDPNYMEVVSLAM